MSDLPLLHHIHDYLEYYARTRGSHEAVVCGDLRLTYAELLARVRACAGGLIAAGIQPGDRVASLCGMRFEYLVVFLATSMVGGVWMGLNPRYSLHELEHIVADGKPKLLFAVSRFAERDLTGDISALAANASELEQIVLLDDGTIEDQAFVSFAAFMRAGCEPGELRRRSDARFGRDPVLLIYTSGTTGRPKGALLSHEGLIARALTQNRTWPCEPIRVVNHLPINHIGGVGFISIYCLVGGGTQFLDERFEAGRFITRLAADRITIWIGMPTIVLMVLGHRDFAPARCADLQWVVWSGAALPASAIKTLRSIGCGLGSSYGLTESSGSVCYAESSLDDETLSRTIGRPVPAGEVRLADAEGNPVAPGLPGEIQLRPEWAMKEYLGRKDASRDALTKDGFVRTGDIGREDEQGCIELVGRLKEMFKSGGYNIYPREIETTIELHPQVAVSAVVPISDPLYQEVGIAFVQPTAHGRLDPAELRSWCAARLANYKVPKQFRVVDQLPVLSIGKIDRQALRALAATAANPKTIAETELAAAAPASPNAASSARTTP
jgi:acyl-CoA synthetase (AMP-forming)/AMP-acid ligase II